MSNQIVMYRYFYRGFNLRLLTLLVLVASTACSSASDTVIVNDGVYSLTETSLSQSKLALRGQWAFFPDRFIEIPEVSSRGFQDSFDKAKRIAVPGEFPEDARSGQRHQAGTLVARVDTRLSTDTVIGVELFENATAHRIQLISDRGEILTSLLAVNQVKLLLMKGRLGRVYPLNLSCQLGSTHSTSSGMSRPGIILGLDHGRVRCFERGLRVGKYPR